MIQLCKVCTMVGRSVDSVEHERFESGLTLRSLFAVVLALLFFIPVSTYTWLITGSSLISSSVFFVLLLVTELFRYSWKPLKTQEALMIYYGISAAGLAGTTYIIQVYTGYFIHSPFAWSATINGVPLALSVPEWIAPRFGSFAYYERTLFQIAYLPAILVYTIRLILTLIATLAMSMLMAQIFVGEEKYSFPFAEVDVSIVSFVTEERSETIKLILACMIPGAMWALITFIGPSLFNMQFIPIPFIDLTFLTRNFIPGAAFGIATILSSYVGGFMVPFVTSFYLLIGSVIVWILLNSLFTTSLSNIFPNWAKEFFPGMGLMSIQNRSFLRIWFAPQIGIGIGAALFMIYKARRGIRAAFKGLFRTSRTRDSFYGFPSNRILLLLYFCSTGAGLILHRILLPELPLWVPVFASIAYSSLLSLVTTAMQGEVGYTAAPGYVWATLVYMTNYKGYGGFAFEPVMVGGTGGFSQQVKACLATRTKPMDLVKLTVITSVLSWIIGLISLDVFWRIANMPSSAYPYTVLQFPLLAQIDVFTNTRQLTFSPEHILGPMGIIVAIAFLGDFLSKHGLPFSLIGVFTSPFVYPAYSIPLFIGSAIGRVLMPRFFGGKEKWYKVRGMVVAGEGLGEGIVILLLTAMSLISKSSWIKPY